MKRLTPVALAIALLLSLLPLGTGTAAAYDVVYVNTNALNVRTAPSISASVVQWVYYGDQVGIVEVVRGDVVGGSSAWYQTISGYYVAAAYLSNEAPAASGVILHNPDYNGRWVDVNLSTLQATAMVGETPVYRAPVTTGKAGYETPTGTFRVLLRLRYETMDSESLGVTSGPEAYYYEDVPYVQHFDNLGGAFHGTYWTPPDAFGNYNTSHSCVSMRVADAAYFWDFGYVGMPVVIHY